MIRANLLPDGDTVAITLGAYLGAERFPLYRAICAESGARWAPATKANHVALASLPAMLRRLADAGLGCEVSAELARRMRDEAAAAERMAAEGRARLDGLDTRLYAYQRVGVQWLAPRRQALLADEMGLGKTVQALLAAPADAAIMVVAPNACAANWIAECRRWRPDLEPALLRGRANFRWPAQGQLLVTTYGSLPRVADDDEESDIPSPGLEVTLIADEAHLLKSKKAQRTRAFRHLRSAVLGSGGRVWLLTGTPLLNRPPELWSVLEAADVARGAFGSWPRFVAMFRGRKGHYGYEWGLPSDDVPLALQRVSLHRRRADVLPDLPRKQRATTVVPADTATARQLAELTARLEEAGLDIDALIEGTRGSSVVFELISRVRCALAAGKLAAAVERVEAYEEEGIPLVVFCAHSEPLRALAQRDGWDLLDGSVPAERRGEIVERFQAGELRGLACNYQAAGVGITLTRATHMLMIDLPWTPALVAQAEDRICRIGQEASSCHYERLVVDHALERRVLELLDHKVELIEASIGASAVEADHLPSIDESMAQAAAAVVVAADDAAEVAARARESQQARDAERARRRAAGALDGDVWGEPVRQFRPPSTPEEAAAAGVLIRVAGMDPDHAQELNGVGFSRHDQEFGHSLADSLVRYGRLSDRQWAAAKKLAYRYRRQA